MVITAIAAVAFDAIGLLTTDTLDHLDEVDFINDVGPFSLIVALLGGGRRDAGVDVGEVGEPRRGVHLGDDGAGGGVRAVALVEGRIDEALSSAAQLLVNLAGIVVAAVLALLAVLRRRHRADVVGRPLSRG